MPVRFHNTLTRRKEVFIPLHEGKVGLYTCGPTVYDTAHIGNFRTFLFEDLLKRYLGLRGFKVFHVMNITDVDDRTIKRSREEGRKLQELTEDYTQKFFTDMNTLKILPADVYPKATDHIPGMIKMIQVLVEKGHAYETEDGSVFYSINSFPEYGRLTHLDHSMQRSTDRIASDDYSKDNPRDFALWKGWKEDDDDVFWESPWGRGRPGWHIECSVMSMAYLGEHFDIHCGGVDNIFPHHENEIAQSKSATGQSFANLWLHSEHLLVDGGKMSKSLGNVYTLDDLLAEGFSSESIRYLFLNTQYRSKINFSLDKKHEAFKAIQRVVDLRDRLKREAGMEASDGSLPDEYDGFIEAMDDDLDTPAALAVFFEWVRRINLTLDKKEFTAAAAVKGLNFIQHFNALFDILPQGIELPNDIRELVRERDEARDRKDWNRSDELRETIRRKGWVIEDLPEGSRCRPIHP